MDPALEISRESLFYDEEEEVARIMHHHAIRECVRPSVGPSVGPSVPCFFKSEIFEIFDFRISEVLIKF